MLLGYHHFAQETFYLDRSRLYRVPASETECTYFTAEPPEPDDVAPVQFPKGGHNYYNCRDIETFRRRLTWLNEAEFPRVGWEEEYQFKVDYHKAQIEAKLRVNNGLRRHKASDGH